MKILPLVVQFVISGSVVVVATLIAKSLDSKWSGLLVALPTLTLLSLLFINLHTSTSTTQRYLVSALIFMLPAAVYLASILFMFGKVSLLTNFLISLVPFAATVLIVQKIFHW